MKWIITLKSKGDMPKGSLEFLLNVDAPKVAVEVLAETIIDRAKWAVASVQRVEAGRSI